MAIRIIIIAFICSISFKSFAQNSGKDNIVGICFSMQSKIMKDERVIQIFLPDGYENSNIEYPVLYILDGQRYFLHGVSLQKSFVEFKETPEYIIVGISKNPSDRNKNFSVNSRNYLDFIKNEVIYYVDKEFRTSKTRMLFGWAYGGGFVVETMTREPNLFGFIYCGKPISTERKNY